MTEAKENLNYQKIIAIVGVVLFAFKIVAWYLTNSVAILTDALESTINVISGFIGLYSLYISAQPRDRNHPYGHGKIEFISAAVEGTLIFVAGLVIIYEAIINLTEPHPVGKLDYGILLVSITALVNYGVGYVAVQRGKKNNSLALIASGKHLQSDTYSTIGIVVGLILLYLTRLAWLDSVVALVFAGLILYTGYKIIRGSLAGIMDEADEELLNKVVALLQKSRRENWIDMHNLRIIKYGSRLHLDCHLTVPWYLTVLEAHKEVAALEKLVRDNFGESVEMFVHMDACEDFSCSICTKDDCQVRKHSFENRFEWTLENILRNQKHNVETARAK
ncbi:cation diffusion facilitator family transporter [Cytophagaceae bacterium YF14B1]|uniref:Cation diffusion facilitator family transporter n=1 Tax=Xanthocytophaga flava TaxID=3048013 RepID=A0AAE3QVI1_9BACT|nr:cation diffusion facilitator family transporter [Xanthocytophaga flavus]MDJ1469924.1 cation diffusion facilitator family transporter [Xanthocytophaga flavus]MDJ1483323.1 cation diffusion facilitator family transporter [Xanthocytophaga flavus]